MDPSRSDSEPACSRPFRSCAASGAFPGTFLPRFTVRFRTMRSPRGRFPEVNELSLSSQPDCAETGKGVNPSKYENPVPNPYNRNRVVNDENIVTIRPFDFEGVLARPEVQVHASAFISESFRSHFERVAHDFRYENRKTESSWVHDLNWCRSCEANPVFS